MWEWRPFEKLVDIDIIIARIDAHQCELLDEELTYVVSAVPERVREFTAGRSLARLLLSHRDIHPESIRAGPDGQPVWPDGITGSISHTTVHVGVAVVSKDLYQGIGFDIEEAGGANQLDLRLVLTRKEMDRLHDGPPADYATKVFSCKEAVFKAVFPIVGEFFEFCDIEISLTGNDFRAAMTKDTSSAGIIANGWGLVAARQNLVATIFCVP